MKHYPDPTDPTKRIPYYTREEIERITWDELKSTDLATDEPGRVCIETFLMRRYGVGLDYVELPGETCGEIHFSPKGVVAVRLRHEYGSGSRGWYLRGRTTAAHEAGHGIFHASEIVPDIVRQEGASDRTFRHRCGEGDIGGEFAPFGGGSFTRHRALEWQANAAMGSLLLPRPAVLRALDARTTEGIPAALRRDGLTFCRDLLAETFETSRDVALYRMLNLFPALADLAARTHTEAAAV